MARLKGVQGWTPEREQKKKKIGRQGWAFKGAVIIFHLWHKQVVTEGPECQSTWNSCGG